MATVVCLFFSHNIICDHIFQTLTIILISFIATIEHHLCWSATGDMDMGRHTVCIRATNDFLEYSKSVGNDLSTPMPMYHFPGLNEGDIWCLCAQRWAQAYNAGKAPKLYLQATHEKTLDYVPLEILKSYAIDAEESNTIINKLNLQRSQLNELMSKGVAGEEDSFQ